MAEFLSTFIWPLTWIIIKILAIVIPIMISVAYLTYAERKVIGAMQLRRGPNVVGPFGLLQPIADGLKLFTKETIIPSGGNRGVFIAAPCITFVLALVAWAVIPFDYGMVLADINVGILYLFAISSLGVYGVLMAGWASNSRYAFLGGLRSAAQMVSYEVSMGFVIVTVLLLSGSLNLSLIVEAQRGLWFVIPLFPMAIIFFVFLIAGIWHGPSWLYVVFGALHGFGLIVNHVYRKLFDYRFNKYIACFFTFNYINLTFVFFRSNNLDNALNIINGMLGFNGFELNNYFGDKIYIMTTLLLAAIVVFCFKNTSYLINKFKPVAQKEN